MPTTLALPDQTANFELLFDRHPLPMWVFDEETLEFLAVNDAAVEAYGYTREEFFSMTVEQIRQPDDFSAFEALRTQVNGHEGARSERSVPGQHRRKDGSILDVESSWSALPFEGRRGMLVVIHDCSAHKRVEAHSRELANLLNLASDAIVVCDLDGNVTFWNQGAAQLYGWSENEALGVQMVELIMRDVSPLEEIERGVREQGEWSGQMQQVTRDGRDLVVNSRWTLGRDEHGQSQSVLVINTDLTETKKLETRFLRAQRLESIGTLASGIAHDLNNILSPILMSSAILRRTVKTPDGERMLGIIESSAERGAGIVKQVLTFARGVEGERLLLQPKHLIGEMGKILVQTFPRNLDIQTQFPPDLWMVTGDATQLHQVLLNLCVNARDAMMPAGGTLTLAAENMEVDQNFARMNPGAQLGNHVVLRVTDTGSGMPPAVMDKIFDPFFTTKEVGKGTGLGLATVIGIVKSHGGVLTVQSEVGVGTTFRVFLPASRSTNAVEKREEEDPASLRGNGELILVVDDEPPIREALVQTLEDFGYRAYTAEDGSDALALFFQRRGEIKLIPTDLAMGQMDGVALVRALRKLDAAVPVIVSSGHCPEEQTIALQALGVRAFLDKPYNGGKLARAVREALTQKPVAK